MRVIEKMFACIGAAKVVAEDSVFTTRIKCTKEDHCLVKEKKSVGVLSDMRSVVCNHENRYTALVFFFQERKNM